MGHSEKENRALTLQQHDSAARLSLKKNDLFEDIENPAVNQVHLYNTLQKHINDTHGKGISAKKLLSFLKLHKSIVNNAGLMKPSLEGRSAHTIAQFSLGQLYRLGSGVEKNLRQAAHYYGLAAEQGSKRAQFNLGLMHERGGGIAKNLTLAAGYFKEAAKQGHPMALKHLTELADSENVTAQGKLAFLYVTGSGVPQDFSKAFKYYKKAADQGDQGAQYNLGVMYEYGDGVSKDLNKAVRYFTLAAKQGHSKAQFNLGLMHERGGGIVKNLTLAAGYFKEAAKQGHPMALKHLTELADSENENASAQERLAFLYVTGSGVPRDFSKAFKYYKKAADHGYKKAQYNLGAMYENGDGVSKDLNKAVEYFALAAQQGHSRALLFLQDQAKGGNASAQFNLGLMHERGRGVTKDLDEASIYFKKAATQGHLIAFKKLKDIADRGSANAQTSLAYLYFSGRGVSKDFAEAFQYSKRAADQGHAIAQYNLGTMYENGDGVSKNLEIALKYYKEAAEQGHEGAKKRYYLSGYKAGAVSWEKFLGFVTSQNVFDPRLIFNDILTLKPRNTKKTGDVSTAGAKQSYKLIANTEGYSRRGALTKNGAKLFRDMSTQEDPIDYAIRLPKGKPKAFMIQVYGGGLTILGDPKAIRKKGRMLLEQGIAVIKLDLVDLRDKGVQEQFNMSKALMGRVQNSIHTFYKTLKETPEYLHSELSDLKNIPIFLQGSSFGGGVAVKHAELFPGTFDGYISHDGTVSTYEYYNAIRNRRPYTSDDTVPGIKLGGHISPVTDLEKLKDPVLLMQNYDDSNVSLTNAQQFYKKARALKKEVELFITERGSALPSDKVLLNRGHFFPDEQNAQEAYIYQLVRFMTKGPSELPALSQWRAHKYNTYIKRKQSNRTLEERFTAEAFRLYKKGVHDNSSPRRIVGKDIAENNEVWKHHYEPLYEALSLMDYLLSHEEDLVSVMNYLKAGGYLTDQVIERAAAVHLGEFIPFVEEYYNVKAPENMDIEKSAQAFIPVMKKEIEALNAKEASSQKYLLYALLIGNPNLMKSAKLHERFKEKISVLEGKKIIDARHAFEDAVIIDQRLARKALAQKVIQGAKRKKAEIRRKAGS